MYWLGLVLFISNPAFGKNPILLGETTISTSAQILKRIQEDSMADIKTKYLRMKMTYKPHHILGGVDFDCRTDNPNAQGTFAGVRVQNNTTISASGEPQMDTIITHRNCLDATLFVEQIRVRGQKLEPMTEDEALRFVRPFEVRDGESYRDYRLIDQTGKNRFDVRSLRSVEGNKDRIYTRIDFDRLKWLEVDQWDSSTERDIFISVHSVQGRSFRMNFEPNPYTLRFHWDSQKLEHFMVDGKITSQVNFDSTLQEMHIFFSVLLMKNVFTESVAKMPATKESQGGVVDTPFMRELQKNYERILNNTESEQVRLFFEKTISDIKAGKLRVEQQ